MKFLFVLVLLINICCYVKSDEEVLRSKRAIGFAPFTFWETADGENFQRTYSTQIINDDNPKLKKFGIRGAAVNDGIFSISTAVSPYNNTIQEGTIWQEKPVDREKQSSFNLELIAYDSYDQEIGDSVPITVQILDKNDNAPVFDKNFLTATVLEDEPSGNSFHKIKATDADSSIDQNNVIKYTKIEGSENPEGNRFKVSENGLITVIGPMDAEKEKIITFQVKAQDRNGNDDGNTAYATVTVEVEDANDHAPQFIGEPYSTQIKETAANGTKVFEIKAKDADVGINSAVSYKITGGNENNRFKVESYPNQDAESYGVIILDKELDYETPPNKYILTIVGYNSLALRPDDPKYETITTVTIEVLDENEPPKFLNTPYYASVNENSNSKLQNLDVQVKAVDYDFGNQVVTFSLPEDEDWFEISQDGTIKTISVVDREDPRVDQETSIYKLVVQATDPENKFAITEVNVEIIDANDNKPQPYGNGWTCNICSEKPDNHTEWEVTVIAANDLDAPENGPPFEFQLLPGSKFNLQQVDDISARVLTKQSRFELGTIEEEIIITDSGSITRQSSNAKLTINVCSCDGEGNTLCAIAASNVGTASAPIIIGIVAFILLLLVLALTAMSYRKRKTVDDQKKDLLYDEDDVRCSLREYHEEGGGEEDNDVYDMAALQPLAPGVPYRMDEKPLFAEPQPRMILPPNAKVEEFIHDAKKQADNDPTAPPFDSLLVFDYEGHGSDAGSLSSLNSGTTDGSQNYDYLKNWGPRFNKIADAYGNYEDSD